jgi:hypothetical protein
MQSNISIENHREMYRSIGAKAITKPVLVRDLQCVVQEIVCEGELEQGADYGT